MELLQVLVFGLGGEFINSYVYHYNIPYVICQYLLAVWDGYRTTDWSGVVVNAELFEEEVKKVGV